MVQDVLIAAAVVTLGSAAVVVLYGGWARALAPALGRRRPMRLVVVLTTGLAFGAFVVTSAALPYTHAMAATSVPPRLYLAMELVLFAIGMRAGRAVLRRRRAPHPAGPGATQLAR